MGSASSMADNGCQPCTSYATTSWQSSRYGDGTAPVYSVQATVAASTCIGTTTAGYNVPTSAGPAPSIAAKVKATGVVGGWTITIHIRPL